MWHSIFDADPNTWNYEKTSFMNWSKSRGRVNFTNSQNKIKVGIFLKYSNNHRNENKRPDWGLVGLMRLLQLFEGLILIIWNCWRGHCFYLLLLVSFLLVLSLPTWNERLLYVMCNMEPLPTEKSQSVVPGWANLAEIGLDFSRSKLGQVLLTTWFMVGSESYSYVSKFCPSGNTFYILITVLKCVKFKKYGKLKFNI